MDLLATPPLGLGHFSVIGVPPLELVGLAAKAGYAAIGLRLHPAFPGSPTYDVPAGSALSREMRRRMEGEGVTVYDVEFVPLDAAFSALALKPVLEDASALGARRLNVCGDDPDGARLVANFAALCDLAAEFGMGVDLEFMAWRTVSSLPIAVGVVEAAARPNGGVLIDALHLSRSGGSPAALLDVAPGLIRSAQLCDARAERPVGNEPIILEARGQRLLPGEGALPLREFVAALPGDAVLSVEVPIGAGVSPEDHARRLFETTQNLLARCRADAAAAP